MILVLTWPASVDQIRNGVIVAGLVRVSEPHASLIMVVSHGIQVIGGQAVSPWYLYFKSGSPMGTT